MAQNITDAKEEFGKLMANTSLSDYEFVILAKMLGLDGKSLSVKELADMLGFNDKLVKSISKRALYKVKMTAEDQAEFDFLLEKLASTCLPVANVKSLLFNLTGQK